MKNIEYIDKYKEAQGDDFASLRLFNNIYDKMNEMITAINELQQRVRHFEDREKSEQEELAKQFRSQVDNH